MRRSIEQKPLERTGFRSTRPRAADVRRHLRESYSKCATFAPYGSAGLAGRGRPGVRVPLAGRLRAVEAEPVLAARARDRLDRTCPEGARHGWTARADRGTSSQAAHADANACGYHAHAHRCPAGVVDGAGADQRADELAADRGARPPRLLRASPVPAAARPAAAVATTASAAIAATSCSGAPRSRACASAAFASRSRAATASAEAAAET